MDIIKKPIITEKMTELTEKYNRYAFTVDGRANKIQIKKAIEDYYDVTVDSVNTMLCIGKKRVRGTKSGMIQGRTSTSDIFGSQRLSSTLSFTRYLAT